MKLGVLADLHWSVAPHAPERWHAPYDFDGLAARCAATVEQLAAHGCELLVVAGDLTHHGDEASCRAALECLLDVSPIPLAVVEGNHDVLRDRDLVPAGADVRAGWRRADAVAREQLVTLRPVGVDPDHRWARDRGLGPVAGETRSTVLVSHFPLVPHAARLAAAGLPFPGELVDRGLLLELLGTTGAPTVVLSGHVHVRDAIAHGSVLQICVPALVEQPHEAAVVEIDPLAQAVRCTRVRGGAPASERGAQPWLLAPPEQRWSFADGSWARHEVGAVRHHVLAEV